MALEDDYGYRVALDMVKTGMQSGVIKLYGVGNNPANAAANGKVDAAYLIALMAGLQAELPKV